jgi:hypothetical protein
MVNYHGFYHLILRHDPARSRPEADTVRLLEEMFGWEWECIVKTARGLKSRSQLILTAPLEIVEHLAVRISGHDRYPHKVSVIPVVGNPDWERRTWSAVSPTGQPDPPVARERPSGKGLRGDATPGTV